jgi:hypothetical protein
LAHRVLLTSAATLFVVESIAIAWAYTAGMFRGFSLMIDTNAYGVFWLEFALLLASVALAVYLLCVVQQRLVSRPILHWPSGRPASNPGSSRAVIPAHSTAGSSDGLLAIAAVLFFAEAATLAITFASSYYTGFSTTAMTNRYGEFSLEFPLVLAALPIAFYVFRVSIDPWLASIVGRRSNAEFGVEPHFQRGLPSSAAPTKPARPWMPWSPSIGVSGTFSRARARGSGWSTSRLVDLGRIYEH